MSSRFNFQDKNSVFILIDNQDGSELGSEVNAEVVIPSSLLLGKNNGAVPVSIEMVAHGKNNESLEKLQAFLNKKPEDFDSNASYVKYTNDVANSWEDISNALNALKFSQQSKSILASINPTGLIDNETFSTNNNIRKKIDGNLSNSVQLPRNASSKTSGSSRGLVDELKKKVVRQAKKKTIIGRKSSENNRQNDSSRSDFPSVDRTTVYSSDNRTTNKNVGKSSTSRPSGGKKDYSTDSRISVGSDMIFKNFREADSSLASSGKSIANCFSSLPQVNVDSVLRGDIDKTARNGTVSSRKNGSVSTSGRSSKNNLASYGVVESTQNWISKKYFIQLPSSILLLSDSDKTVNAIVGFSDGTTKKFGAKIVTGGKKFVPDPIKSASVSANQIGHNILSINVNDKNTDEITIYRRERMFSSNKIKSSMEKIGSIKIDGVSESRNSKSFTFIDKNIKSQGITYEYRLLSSNKVGYSYDFYDVVSKSNNADGSKLKQGRVDNHSGIFLKELGKKISIKIDNIHPSAQNITLMKKNLTLRESKFTKTDIVLPVGKNGSVEFEDKSLREWNEYEYSYVVEDKFGNVSKNANSKIIRYQRMVSDDPDGERFNTEVVITVPPSIVPIVPPQQAVIVPAPIQVPVAPPVISSAPVGSSSPNSARPPSSPVVAAPSSVPQPEPSGFVIGLSTNIDQAVLGDDSTSDIILDSLKSGQASDEITSTVYGSEFIEKKDELARNIIVNKVDIVDMETKETIYSGHIKGSEFDSSKMKETKDMDLSKKEYRVVVTTAAVDLEKHIDENARKKDSIREFGTIPSFKGSARTILDDSVVGVKDVVIGTNRTKKPALINNLKKESFLDKHIVSWDAINSENVDFYIVEKAPIDDSYPWKYVGKTMFSSLESKSEDLDYITGVKYRVKPFYTFNELGTTIQESEIKKERGTGGGTSNRNNSNRNNSNRNNSNRNNSNRNNSNRNNNSGNISR